MLSLPTAYLPPLDYFAAIVREGAFFIDGNRTCRKQTFANRAYIVTSQGTLTLSVPCIKPNGSHTLEKDVLICYRENWQRDHWRSIVTAYNKSPYFLYYRDELEMFYTQITEKLIDFNNALLDFVIEKLHLPVKRGAETDSPLALDFGPKQPEKYHIEPYMQTFPCEAPRHHLSILDLMFNVGPESVMYLRSTLTSQPLP